MYVYVRLQDTLNNFISTNLYGLVRPVVFSNGFVATFKVLYKESIDTVDR